MIAVDYEVNNATTLHRRVVEHMANTGQSVTQHILPHDFYIIPNDNSRINGHGRLKRGPLLGPAIARALLRCRHSMCHRRPEHFRSDEIKIFY